MIPAVTIVKTQFGLLHDHPHVENRLSVVGTFLSASRKVTLILLAGGSSMKNRKSLQPIGCLANMLMEVLPRCRCEVETTFVIG